MKQKLESIQHSKTKILDIEGKPEKEIELPSCFNAKVREDIISKVLEAMKTKQPYSPSLVAGKQHSASGVVQHRRHVWKSGYGRGISRVARKIMTRRGSQFNWVGAETAQTRGGRRAHPPKILAAINTSKINKKEAKIAFESALAASADEEYVKKKYESLKDKKIKVPFIVDNKFVVLRVKQIIDSLKKILGEEVFEVARKKKAIRSGKGKLRGRKYKVSAGLLIVIGKNEKLKIKAFDVAKADKLSVEDLAKGGAGRLALYTENAISELDKRLSSSKNQTKELNERLKK